MRSIRLLWLALAVHVTVCGAASTTLPPLPAAPKRPVTDAYWGVKVVDEYQYMEKLANPEVRSWAVAQNAFTRAWLDGHTERDSVLARVVALTHPTSPEYFYVTYRSSAIFFAMKSQPPQQQPFLVAFISTSMSRRLALQPDPNEEQTIVDPNLIDSTGATSIDFYVPSLDGRYVTVSLSKGGTEDGTLHIYEVATGKEMVDLIPRVNGGTAGGSVAWNARGNGIYYTRYPHEGERPAGDLPFYQQVWFHKIGEPIAQDRYVIGKEFPKIAEIALETRGDGRNLLVDVSNGDGGEHEFWLVPLTQQGEDAAVRFAKLEDRIVDAKLGLDRTVYLLSRDGAPTGKILKMPAADPNLTNATVIVPESEASITDFVPMENQLDLIDTWGGPSRVRVFDLDGNPLRTITQDGVSNYSSLVPLVSDRILLRIESYTQPPAFWRSDPQPPALVVTPLASHSPADFGDCEVRRETAPADDGTKIPVTIVMRKGTAQDGTNPVLLTGYGSYGMSQHPSFDADKRVWIERGGVWAIASVRGGGEFGDAWHRAANLDKKKTSMDDFAACARFLVAGSYTTPERLAIEGGSAGGLLMYGVMVHYPDLMRAVVAHVGYGDVLRTELSPNGLFNTTEFGTVKNETQFRGMYDYSPYHHVVNGISYPALLATTGLNDPRVEPWQSFKMVARLQAATASGAPILLRTSARSGHGIGTALSERDQELADTYTFLFSILNVKVEGGSPAR